MVEIPFFCELNPRAGACSANSVPNHHPLKAASVSLWAVWVFLPVQCPWHNCTVSVTHTQLRVCLGIFHVWDVLGGQPTVPSGVLGCSIPWHAWHRSQDVVPFPGRCFPPGKWRIRASLNILGWKGPTRIVTVQLLALHRTQKKLTGGFSLLPLLWQGLWAWSPARWLPAERFALTMRQQRCIFLAGKCSWVLSEVPRARENGCPTALGRMGFVCSLLPIQGFG